MTTFLVTCGMIEFNDIEAETAQQARDIVARTAGYDSEADMALRLGHPSRLIAEEAE
jgi:hypothetical protein